MGELAFAPIDGADKHINISGSNQRVLVFEGPKYRKVPVRIQNQGTATVWIKAGDVTVAATTSSMPIGAGATEVLRFRIPESGQLYIGAIAASTTGYISFTPGDGI